MMIKNKKLSPLLKRAGGKDQELNYILLGIITHLIIFINFI